MSSNIVQICLSERHAYLQLAEQLVYKELLHQY